MIKFNSSLALLGIIISLTSVSIYAQTSYVKNSLGAEHTLLPLTGSALMSTLETGNGLKATYFNNKTLSGFPSVTRTGGNINYNWGAGSPDPAVHSDGFSARWAGQIKPRYSETYTFYTQSDDGISLWVNDTLLIYSWSDHSVMEDSATITLTAGTKYNIVAEYYENAGQAIAKLWWKSNSQPKEVVPISQLYSDGQIPVTPTTNGLKAYYFNNTTLSGTPALTRIDREINFDWQEIFRIFHEYECCVNPDFKLGKPDEKKLREILSSRDFSEERINSALEKLRENTEKGKQKTLF